uniref:Uncharacterized protein n=1 Tax=Romanomermis culicivorax TaxID=13658 RepID=A0A915HTL5_ROMCU
MKRHTSALTKDSVSFMPFQPVWVWNTFFVLFPFNNDFLESQGLASKIDNLSSSLVSSLSSWSMYVPLKLVLAKPADQWQLGQTTADLGGAKSVDQSYDESGNAEIPRYFAYS